MEYQNIANLLERTSYNLSKFRTRNWIEINDESRRNYANGNIKFKTTMIRSNLCDYADSYILVKGTITNTGAGDDDAAKQADERDKGVTFKNCAPFTRSINRINNTDIDNAHDIDIVMPMYNLIEYSDNYSKTSRSLWQYYKDDPNDNIADSESFKSKVFSNTLSVEIKFSKTQLSEMIQSGGFLGKLLGPLLKTGSPLIKNVITPLTKSVLIPLGLTAAASATEAGIHKKILGSGNTILIRITILIKIVNLLKILDYY